MNVAIFSSNVLCLVAQSCLTLCSPMGWNPSASSVHGALQVRILEWLPCLKYYLKWSMKNFYCYIHVAYLKLSLFQISRATAFRLIWFNYLSWSLEIVLFSSFQTEKVFIQMAWTIGFACRCPFISVVSSSSPGVFQQFFLSVES